MSGIENKVSQQEPVLGVCVCVVGGGGGGVRGGLF